MSLYFSCSSCLYLLSGCFVLMRRSIDIVETSSGQAATKAYYRMYIYGTYAKDMWPKMESNRTSKK